MDFESVIGAEERSGRSRRTDLVKTAIIGEDGDVSIVSTGCEDVISAFLELWQCSFQLRQSCLNVPDIVEVVGPFQAHRR